MALIQAMADHLTVCGAGLLLATVAGAGQCRAGDEASPQAAPAGSDALASESILSPDCVLSRDDWKLRIEEARKRSDQARQESSCGDTAGAAGKDRDAARAERRYPAAGRYRFDGQGISHVPRQVRAGPTDSEFVPIAPR